MAKGRGGRGPTRMDKRREADAVEARETEEVTEESEEVEEEAEEEPDADVEVEAEAEGDEGDGDGDDEDGGKKKKKKVVKKKAVKKPAAAKKKPATKRSRAAKEVRRKAVWRVFDNASKIVDEFPFNQKAEAEALLAKKLLEKEGKATFYLNLVKVEMATE